MNNGDAIQRLKKLKDKKNSMLFSDGDFNKGKLNEVVESLELAIDTLQQLESGKLVMVIRCKDCKNSAEDTRIKEFPRYCYIHSTLVKDDAFCSSGRDKP